MSLGFSIEQEQQTKQFQRQSAALLAKADLVCSASPLEVQRYLQELEQQGKIVQDISVGYEELAIDEGLFEKEFDAEWDFSDEDALTIESDERVSVVPETEPFLSGRDYVLRVFRNEDGGVEIDVPEMGGEGYIDSSMEGETILYNLACRRNAYHAIAKWLLELDAIKRTNSPVEFLSLHQKITQDQFLADLKKERNLVISKGAFSKYLGAARLVWGRGSIALRQLFK
jgi:hypothetical protein